MRFELASAGRRGHRLKSAVARSGSEGIFRELYCLKQFLPTLLKPSGSGGFQSGQAHAMAVLSALELAEDGA